MRSISPELLAKIKEQNQTIWNGAQPKMSVQVSRAKDTVMDSTYWTVETIRTKEGLGDLSVAARRFKPYGPPNRLYNIYVDNGVVKTAIREYPDYSKEKWKTQFELGSGTAVAMAFDGHWEHYRKRWQLVTDEKPYLFFVNGNKLYSQIWDDVASRFELATNVVKVKALRGWKNVNFVKNDHGIIVAYIKTDGKVYYRNYCGQVDGTYIWENERQVAEFTGTAVNLNLFITNDYRTGIVIEDSTGNIRWLITTRNWAGMAIAPEKFNVRAKAEIGFIPVNYIRPRHDEYFNVTSIADIKFLYGADFNKFTEIEQMPVEDADQKFEDNEGLNYGSRIRFTVKYKIIDFDINGFEMLDANNVKFRCTNYVRINDYTFICTFEDFNNAAGDLTLYNLVNKNTNEAGYYFTGFSKEFTPTNLIPDLTGAPEVEVAWNE